MVWTTKVSSEYLFASANSKIYLLSTYLAFRIFFYHTHTYTAPYTKHHHLDYLFLPWIFLSLLVIIRFILYRWVLLFSSFDIILGSFALKPLIVSLFTLLRYEVSVLYTRNSNIIFFLFGLLLIKRSTHLQQLNRWGEIELLRFGFCTRAK